MSLAPEPFTFGCGVCALEMVVAVIHAVIVRPVHATDIPLPHFLTGEKLKSRAGPKALSAQLYHAGIPHWGQGLVFLVCLSFA